MSRLARKVRRGEIGVGGAMTDHVIASLSMPLVSAKALGRQERSPSQKMKETLELRGSRARDGHRLLRVGMVLFLFALLVGLAVPRFAVPRLGLSTHLLGLMQGTFLLAAGSLWPKLTLTRAVSRAGSYLAAFKSGR
jgi:hypothetical protein